MSGSREFRLGLTRDILPALDAFRPELLLISAGFDAHRSDPLAQLLLDESDYVWVTEQLLEAARRHAGGRVVSTLEGGYDLPALGASAAAHVRTLMSAGLDSGGLLQSGNDFGYSRAGVAQAQHIRVSIVLS